MTWARRCGEERVPVEQSLSSMESSSRRGTWPHAPLTQNPSPFPLPRSSPLHFRSPPHDLQHHQVRDFCARELSKIQPAFVLAVEIERVVDGRCRNILLPV